jgi:hypothetical protein
MDIRKSNTTPREHYKGKHRFEHWYRNNQVYFITSRCRDRFPAFATDETKAIFWEKFERYTTEFSFTPWVTSLLDNHYHTLGYLKIGESLPVMMQRVHGSVAKLVNDTLDMRLLPFWVDSGKQNYFDGCIRDEVQCRRAYRYTLTQCRRHGICSDPGDYPHTHVNIDAERGVKRALELRAFLEGVPYARYERKRKSRRS